MDDTKCVRCGSDFPPGGVYCPVCGARRSNVGLWVKEARNAATRAIDVSVEALGRASKEVEPAIERIINALQPAVQEIDKAVQPFAETTVRTASEVADRLRPAAQETAKAVTRPELRALLDRGGTPRAYVGLEPSGLMHIGTAFVIGSKVTDLVESGFHAIIYLADWHAYINDKLGGNLDALRVCAEYF